MKTRLHISIILLALLTGLMGFTTEAVAITAGDYVEGYPRATSSTTIEVKWVPFQYASTNTRYQVQWKEAKGGSWVNGRQVMGTLPYKISGLYSDTEYIIRVHAVDYDNTREYWYKEKSVTTLSDDKTPPSIADKSLTLAATSREITVQWNAASDNKTSAANLEYWIYVADNASALTDPYHNNLASPHDQTGAIQGTSGTFTTTVKGYSDGNSYDIFGYLNPSTTYYVTVAVVDEAKNVAYYTAGEIRTKDKTDDSDKTPPTIANKTLTLSATAKDITVQWNAASDNKTSAANLEYWIYVADNASALTDPYHKNLASPHDQTGAIQGTSGTFTTTVNGYSDGNSYI